MNNIIEMKYRTSGGQGHMVLNADKFFPCKVADMRFLLKKVIPLLDWEQQENVVKQMEDACNKGLAELEQIPMKYAEINRKIERYKRNLRDLKQRKG